MSRITIMTDRLKSPRTQAQPGNVSVCAAHKMADWHTDVFSFALAPELLVLGRPLQFWPTFRPVFWTAGTFCRAPEIHQGQTSTLDGN